MIQNIGRRTFCFEEQPVIIGYAAVAGKKEGEGPLGGGFDLISEDAWFGQDSREKAWKHYMAYTKQGGSRTFTELLANAGLVSPFDEECLKTVCSTAKSWLENYDMTGIE